jgi:hypothetical protein
MIQLFSPSRIINYDEELEVFRERSVVWVNGKAQDYDTCNFNIFCNIQPLNGRDLLLVPEGDRFKEQYWVWTDSKVDKYTLAPNDRIVRQGANFQVQTIEEWGNYNRARMVRIDVGPYANCNEGTRP